MVVSQTRLLEIVGLNLSLEGHLGLGQVKGQHYRGILGGGNKMNKIPESGIHSGNCVGHSEGDTDRR